MDFTLKKVLSVISDSCASYLLFFLLILLTCCTMLVWHPLCSLCSLGRAMRKTCFDLEVAQRMPLLHSGHRSFSGVPKLAQHIFYSLQDRLFLPVTDRQHSEVPLTTAGQRLYLFPRDKHLLFRGFKFSLAHPHGSVGKLQGCPDSPGEGGKHRERRGHARGRAGGSTRQRCQVKEALGVRASSFFSLGLHPPFLCSRILPFHRFLQHAVPILLLSSVRLPQFDLDLSSHGPPPTPLLKGINTIATIFIWSHKSCLTFLNLLTTWQYLAGNPQFTGDLRLRGIQASAPGHVGGESTRAKSQTRFHWTPGLAACL
ncbi:uncharacterized protein LOC118497018 [Phyllostomus discolor]|uniref:Uncharacterized protein LOC118497018 n=1 Tax=Phyllostomus discolor TaxID=89673 RepID=A0A7E6CH45_9CHIR|nr:uncharacterized protein LOC118497018 [Phyllostomus discolor]